MKTGRKKRFRSVTICLYTNTPDEHFWIDRQPVLRPRPQIRQRHLRNPQRPRHHGQKPVRARTVLESIHIDSASSRLTFRAPRCRSPADGRAAKFAPVFRTTPALLPAMAE